MTNDQSGSWRQSCFLDLLCERICATMRLALVSNHDNGRCAFKAPYMPKSMLSVFQTHHLIASSHGVSNVSVLLWSAHFQGGENRDIERQSMGLSLGDTLVTPEDDLKIPPGLEFRLSGRWGSGTGIFLSSFCGALNDEIDVDKHRIMSSPQLTQQGWSQDWHLAR